jgi:hypothetical protein
MRLRFIWLFLVAAIAVGGVYTSGLRATPALGNFMSKPLATASFDDIDINLHTVPADIWQLRFKTKGQTDLYVQSNAWPALSSTGWHTHPGPSLVVITAGTVTAYEGDDPTCSPHLYSALLPGVPNHFIDPGGGHVHVVRNEDALTPAAGVAVQLIPGGELRRIDAPAPDSCPATIR